MTPYKKELTEYFSSKDRVILAYLFGSTVRGDAGRLSDVDIGILVDEKMPKKERFDMELIIMGEISSLIRKNKIDLIVLNEAPLLLAYKNADDKNHKKAANIFKKLNAGEYVIGVISEFIFSEVTTVLELKINMDAAKEVGTVLLEAKEIEIMKASEVFERAWEIFSNREDTGLSFVDASNIACMEQRKIRKIATFDRDFARIKSIDIVNS